MTKANGGKSGQLLQFLCVFPGPGNRKANRRLSALIVFYNLCTKTAALGRVYHKLRMGARQHCFPGTIAVEYDNAVLHLFQGFFDA